MSRPQPRWSFQRAELKRKVQDASVRLAPYREAQVRDRLALASYKPIEEILESPAVRLLRAMRWFDWVTGCDLLDILGVESDPDSLERMAHRQALARLTRAGNVEVRRYGCGTSREYRITPAGRALIADKLRRVA